MPSKNTKTGTTSRSADELVSALWQIFHRPEKPPLWDSSPWGGGNLPWDDPAFSERMLRQHLEQAHGAASRPDRERVMQIDWLWTVLGLDPSPSVLDVTCGPGLYAVDMAVRGGKVTGIDFSPAAVAYARRLAETAQVEARCRFVEQDVREMNLPPEQYDAAILLYGQLAVFTRDEAQQLLATIARALRPGGRLCVELLAQDRVTKEYRSWWYTSDAGLWGEAPYLCLGESTWYEAEAVTLDRYYLLHLETGTFQEIAVTDQTYAVAEVEALLHKAGFRTVSVYPASAGLPLSDAPEWILYVAEK